MAEYIEREAAIEQIKAEWAKLPLSETTGFGVLMRVLTSIPAADVRPVVRGKWTVVGTRMFINLENAREQYTALGYPHRNIECRQCSICKKVSMVDASILYEYCPHCGARMEES